MWMLLREVSLRHLRHAPLRTALVVFGISLGVCMLTAVLATNDSLSGAFEDMVQRIAGKADLTVTGSEAGIPGQLTARIAALPGIAHVAPVLEISTRSADRQGGALLVLGMDFLGDTFFLPFEQRGSRPVIEDPLAFVNDPRAILVSRKLAATHALALGDALPLATADGVREFYVRGLLEDQGPVASFGGQVAVMFIDAAQLAFARGDTVDRIDVALRAGASREQVQRQIARVIAGKASVEPPAGRGRRLVGALWAFRNGLNMTGGVALCVGMFLIYNAVSVSVAQRRREVGTLRALGVTRRRMIWLFCLEALVMAGAGVVLGLLCAHQLARFALSSVTPTVNRFFMPIQPATPALSPRVLLAGVVAGFVATLAAAYLPARSAASVEPAEALRATRWSAPTRGFDFSRLPWFALGCAALALGLAWVGSELVGYLANAFVVASSMLLVPAWVKGLRRGLGPPAQHWLGMPGRLALDGVERALGRSAISVGALMLTVALSVSIATYSGSFERSLLRWTDQAFPGDALVTQGSPIIDRNHRAFAPGALAPLAGTPGLSATNPLRVTHFDVGGRRAMVQSTDTRIAFTQGARRGHLRPVIDGPRRFEPDALYERPRVIISESAVRYQHLSVGDSVEFDTPSGLHRFEVYAVVVDYSSDQGWYLMDRRWYAQYWQDSLVDALELYFAPGSAHEAVVRAVRSRLSGVLGLFVTSHGSLRAEMAAGAQALFAYSKAPELISLIVAIMGVMGTMLATVLDRLREIGILRAVGATRRQVTTSLVAEAGFLGLSAACYGVLVGVPLGYTLLKVVGSATSGWNLPYVYPVDTALRVASMVVAAATLAGLLPGRRAAAMDVKEALGYE